MVLSDTCKAQIKEHALFASPDECCGLLVYINGEIKTWVCKNIADNKRQYFRICPNDYWEASKAGKIVAFYHSHALSEFFSDFDKLSSEKHNLIAILYSIESDAFNEYCPQGLELPFINRQYVTGHLDCFSLVKDYYNQKFNINLPELTHPFRFITDKENHPENKKVHSTLPDYFSNAGFVRVSSPKEGDIILMKGRKVLSPVHVGIYLQPDNILHHPLNRLSKIEHYNFVLKGLTTHFFRHESLN
jgi:proteasome lid subunit RPN8/RPN11